jgi:sarcosine oxidase
LSVAGPALWEPTSGVLGADDALLAFRRGLDVREGTRVMAIDDDGRKVRVALASAAGRHHLRASVVVVCAGPWTGPLVAGAAVGLRARATLEQVAYLVPAAPGADAVSIDDVPVFVERRQPWFYGLPVRSEGRVKVALHGAGPAVALDLLDAGRSDEGPDAGLLAELLVASRRVLRGMASDPVASERCLYDNSPDGDFVVDRQGRLVIGSGTSGHGFKFAPLLGELMADLATGSPPGNGLVNSADLERFWSSRLPSLSHREGPPVHP